MEAFMEQYLMDPTVGKIIATFVGILILITVVKFFQRTLTRYIKDTDTRYRARKFISVFGYLLGILLLGIIFSDRLGKLTVAFGVAGAGIAFALQEVIASVAGWVAISFGRFYKTGDRIQLGGIKGDVIDISLLRTTLMECGDWVKGDQYNGRIVRVANSFVFKEAVFNYSADFPFLWDEIMVPVRHGSDIGTVQKLLLKIADDIVGDYAKKAKIEWKKVVHKYMIYEAAVVPTLFMAANENWMEFSLRYVVDFKRRRATKTLLYERILKAFNENADAVAIASTGMDIQLKEAPPVSVTIKQ